MISCDKCGFENKDGSKFCKKCGKELYKSSVTVEVTEGETGINEELKIIREEREGRKPSGVNHATPWMILGVTLVVIGIVITMFALAWTPGVTVTEEYTDGSTNTYWEESENYDAEMQERAYYIWEGIIFVIVGFLIFVISGLKWYVREQKGEPEKREIIEKEYAPVFAKPSPMSKSGFYSLIFFILSLVVIFGSLFSFNIQSGQNNQNGGGYDVEHGSGYVFVVVHNEHSAQYVDIWVDGSFSKTIWVGSYSSSSCSVDVGSGTHYIMAKGESYSGSDGANVQGGDDIILYV